MSIALSKYICQIARYEIYGYFWTRVAYTVWSSELDTLLMRYEVNLTPYRIKSISNSLDQTVEAFQNLTSKKGIS